LSGGALAGIIVGAIAVIAIIGGIFYIRRRAQKKLMKAELDR